MVGGPKAGFGGNCRPQKAQPAWRHQLFLASPLDAAKLWISWLIWTLGACSVCGFEGAAGACRQLVGQSFSRVVWREAGALVMVL